MSFLNAEWRKLALANYVVDIGKLQKYLPAGTEFDLWNGKCYVSLVGFMFVNTKLLGVKVPFHVNFEEVNLRFYVKRVEGEVTKRGVVFIKELVPKAALTLVANTVYNEHYQTLPMWHKWQNNEESLVVEYGWTIKGMEHLFKVEAESNSVEIEAGSEAEFITEHYWGYTQINNTKSFEYEVTHPRWLQYPVKNHSILVDYKETYGPNFEWLNSAIPASVYLAEGSDITVENKKIIDV